MSDPAENDARVQAHDTYTHGEDGRVCIVLQDCWFVPLDAGGEGFPCERPHGPTAEPVDTCLLDHHIRHRCQHFIDGRRVIPPEVS